ncbi:hypothetical protein SteCoe_15392 [Stentor coeruleus]|uniref:Major facilitator superfamily (MFS) profile domain-containing protein n=1 Tax=Stentor coeruleus TaxID=5963 RepID=A0A1R2C3M1_9CILI|nr:hypothetical protein SteCoe_15392 [Stentor coeruleus]
MCMEYLDLSPKMLLCLYLCIGTLITLDQFAFNSLLTDIKNPEQGGIDVGTIGLGLIGSTSLLATIPFSPVSAYFSQSYNSNRIIFIGIIIWGIGTLLTSMALNFWTLLVSRLLVGFGASAFISLCNPCVLEIAPEDKKTIWLGIVSYNQMLGIVIGLNYGPFIKNLTGIWRYAFVFDFFLAIPLAIFLILPKENQKLIFRPKEGSDESMIGQIKIIIQNPVLVAIILGVAALAFVGTGFSYWTIDFLQTYFHMESESANFIYSMLQLVSGLFGIGAGSLLLTWLMSEYQEQYDKNIIDEEVLENYRVRKGLELSCFCSIGVLLSVSIATISDNLNIFLIFLGFGCFFGAMFVTPSITAMLFCVPKHLKSQTTAISGVLICLLGNFLAPVVIGSFFNSFGYYWGMILNSSWCVWSVLYFFLAWNTARLHGGPYDYSWNYFNCKKSYSRYQNLKIV